MYIIICIGVRYKMHFLILTLTPVYLRQVRFIPNGLLADAFVIFCIIKSIIIDFKVWVRV